jgi:hypothetical protein
MRPGLFAAPAFSFVAARAADREIRDDSQPTMDCGMRASHEQAMRETPHGLKARATYGVVTMTAHNE